MKRKLRYRYREKNTNEGAYVAPYQWQYAALKWHSPNQGDPPQWHAHSIAGLSTAGWETSQHKMRDTLSKGVWQYNPIEHVHLRGHYRRRFISGTPDFTIHVTPKNHLSIGDVSQRYACREIVEAAKANTQFFKIAPFTDILNDEFPVEKSLSSVKGLFASPRLPHKVTIDRDPFDTDFSIWFLLADVLSYKRLIKRFWRWTDPLKGGNYNRPLPLGEIAMAVRRMGMSPQETAKQFHNRHLGFRFGVLPFIDDIRKFISQINNWDKKYRELGKLSTRRYRSHNRASMTDWEIFAPKFEVVPLMMGNGSYFVNVQVDQSYQVKWHGLTLYGFACPELVGWVSRLKQIVDSFGLLDPAGLWDLIPFSFVVDWFFSISSWLHKNRPRLFPALAVICDYLESIKIVCNVKYTATWSEPNSSIGVGEAMEGNSFVTAHIGQEQYTTYVRQRFLPDVSMFKMGRSVRKVKSATFLERIAIAASLIGQRLTVTRHPRLGGL